MSMSKKRKSAESNDDEQTNEASDLFQPDAKRARRVPFYPATLQDLPNELLEDVLIKAVVREVMDMRLAKSVWEEKADIVINRLKTVCSRWSSLLTTNVFRSRVHGILDNTAQTLRLEVLHQFPVHSFSFSVATVRDEIFLLCKSRRQGHFINVHDRNELAKVKEVIPLSGMHPMDITGCGVSNCVYVLNKESHSFVVLRITKDDRQRFYVSPWINDLSLDFPLTRLFVSFNGSLIVLQRKIERSSSVISVYDTDGSLQHVITLCPPIHDLSFIFSVLPKSNGNLVLCAINTDFDTELKEIDMHGTILRQYRSMIFGEVATIADAYGRIMITELDSRPVLLDSELNVLEYTDPQPEDRSIEIYHGMHYNSQRNEVVRLYDPISADNANVLAIFRFTGD